MADSNTTQSRGLLAHGVSVSFGPVHALRDVSLELRPGEIHSLCGENGAGKSTLIKCLGGALSPSGGHVEIDSAPLPPSVRDAEHAGVAVIHQEPLAFPDLSATDTIFMGRELTTCRGWWLDRRRMETRATELLASLGESFSVRRPARLLSLAQRQMTAVARGIAGHCRYIIFDEPTASLSSREADVLHALLRRLTAGGAGVLLVSHRLDEVLALSDRVSVLRDGVMVATRGVRAAGAGHSVMLTRDELVRLMVGRDLVTPPAPGDAHSSVDGESPDGPPTPRLEPHPALRVRALRSPGAFEDISFEAHRGEILGLGGLIGAGRSEVARAVAGIDRPQQGEVQVGGRVLRLGDARAAIRAGLVLVPEDRRDQGLVMPISVASNIGLTSPPPRDPAFTRRGFIRRGRLHEAARECAARLRIKSAGLLAPVGTLSGGNQQKVLLAKWLLHRPGVLILDEPTRGVDVGAKAEIHSLVRRLAADGTAVLLISSDLPELLALSHRVLVMREGRVAGQLPAGAAPEDVLRLAVPRGDARAPGDAG